MNDIFNYQVHPYLTDQEFFNSFSVCSKNNILSNVRTQKMQQLLYEGFDKLIKKSFPFRDGYMKIVLEDIYKDLYYKINHFEDHRETDEIYLFFNFFTRISRIASIHFKMHGFDFHDYEKSKYFNSSIEHKCVSNFDYICDLVYYKYNEDDFGLHNDIQNIKLNHTYRIPPNYMKIFKKNYPYAYALIY